METIMEKGKKVLVARRGYLIQSVTDGSILGKKLILSKKDSEIHYREIPIPSVESENNQE